MKAGTHRIEVEAQLVLTSRELQLLHHIFSHDLNLKGMASSHYCGGVTEKELGEFKQVTMTALARLMDRIEDNKNKLFINP